MGTSIGHWNRNSGHIYHRRSVQQDVQRFEGWKKLQSLCDKVPEYNHERNKVLFATPFLTGGRIEEALQLRKSNFIVQDEQVIVRDMRLLKRYEKTGSWIEWVDVKPSNKLARLYKFDETKQQYWRNRYYTETKKEVRSEFRFSTTEPLASLLVEWLENCKDYLFSGYSKDQLSYSMAYRIITATGVYPHWLRAQRASCLISEYGWRMEMMMEWMGWEELSTARHYARYGPTNLVAGKNHNA